MDAASGLGERRAVNGGENLTRLVPAAPAQQFVVAVGFRQQFGFDTAVPPAVAGAGRPKARNIEKKGLEEFIKSDELLSGEQVDVTVMVEEEGADADHGARQMLMPPYRRLDMADAFVTEVVEQFEIDFHYPPE